MPQPPKGYRTIEVRAIHSDTVLVHLTHDDDLTESLHFWLDLKSGTYVNSGLPDRSRSSDDFFSTDKGILVAGQLYVDGKNVPGGDELAKIVNPGCKGGGSMKCGFYGDKSTDWKTVAEPIASDRRIAIYTDGKWVAWFEQWGKEGQEIGLFAAPIK